MASIAARKATPARRIPALPRSLLVITAPSASGLRPSTIDPASTLAWAAIHSSVASASSAPALASSLRAQGASAAEPGPAEGRA